MTEGSWVEDVLYDQWQKGYVAYAVFSLYTKVPMNAKLLMTVMQLHMWCRGHDDVWHEAKCRWSSGNLLTRQG